MKLTYRPAKTPENHSYLEIDLTLEEIEELKKGRFPSKMGLVVGAPVIVSVGVE